MDVGFERLRERVLEFIGLREASGMVVDREGFEALALDIFRWQYGANRLYAAFCDAQGVAPDGVTGLAGIPAVPTSAFKRHNFFCFDGSEAQGWFATSGTTDGSPGRRFFRDLGLYEATWPKPFERALVPGGERLPIASLVPGREWAPHSSLSFMVERAMECWGSEGSACFAGEAFTHGGVNFDWEGLFGWLDGVEAGEGPVLLLGTSFSWVFFLDAWVCSGRRGWRLPRGSRLMETGGYKGRSRDVPREELRLGLTDALGLAAGMIVGEYGMTELSSQFYEAGGCGGQGRTWFGVNPWALTAVVDPWSGEVIFSDGMGVEGRRGLLRVLDLGNLDSVLAIQTEDLAILSGAGGFRIEGRASGAELRGCSLDTEMFSGGCSE